jgi:competence protein ComEC
MTTVAAPPAVLPPARRTTEGLAVWQAPLVPIAVAVSAGIVIDRFAGVPVLASLAVGVACLIAYIVCSAGPRQLLALVYLWTAAAALACAYHHWRHTGIADDDVRHLASEEGRPARLRGVVDGPPTFVKGAGNDPLRSMAGNHRTRFGLRVTAVQDPQSRAWRSASGLVQVNAPMLPRALAAGDALEVVGKLAVPEPPANPGEFNYAAFLSDRQISALLSVREPAGIVVLEADPTAAFTSWPAIVRGWGQNVLTTAVAASEGDLAAALLLGDSPGMTTSDWDLYLRTGVIHVLAISGQHLVVLAMFLWGGLKLARVPRRRGVPFVALVLFLYALVVGGRPPVMRSAWMVLAYSGGVWWRRPTLPANTFALAWIIVAIWNPADIFNAGCQLSFLAVAVLVWGVPGITHLSGLLRLNIAGSLDPLDQLIEESRPWPLQLARRLMRWVGEAYLINLLVWLAVTPLAAFHFHLVSPIALIIGPPLVLLTSIALLMGFAVLAFAPIAMPLAWPFAFVTRWSLAACAGLTEFGSSLPGAYFYVPDIPTWWLTLFYATMLIALALRLPERRPLPTLAALLGGLALGLTITLWPHHPGEFRCTFLAVGHGGCAVIETPNGRVLLYDVGSIAGPDLSRRYVAPYLWTRGIRRIDDVMLSHADLDHFNGVPDLLERFSVGRIVHTPTFPQRDIAAVRVALDAIDRRGIPRRVVTAGKRWTVDGLVLEVLHPPAEGPSGKENARSLVLRLRHEGVSILLTGDLEDAGLDQVLAMPSAPADVLMAPHHGSARSNIPALAQWASPRFVVMCQARSDNTELAARAYAPIGSTVLGTWPHGAITVRSDVNGAWVETFRSGRRYALP